MSFHKYLDLYVALCTVFYSKGRGCVIMAWNCYSRTRTCNNIGIKYSLITCVKNDSKAAAIEQKSK